MSEMTERVARAMRERYNAEFIGGGCIDFEKSQAREEWLACARAAIEAIDAGLRDLLKGEFSSLTIGFNDASAPNYCSVAKFHEEGGAMAEHGDWTSDQERDKAIAGNSEWSLQWYPDTPVGFYCVKASSLTAILDAALQEKE